MDIINHYEVVTYKPGDIDKYTNDYIWFECTIHYMNGYRHRDDDLPAIINANGKKEWLVNGKRHRDNDKPAVIYSSGTQEWYINGQRHRDNDQPAIIYSTGEKSWWVNGKYIGSD